MFCQSNIMPRLAGTFDPSKNTFHGNIKLTPPGILITFKWAKNTQCMGRSPLLLPILVVQGHPADSVAAY